MVLLLYTLHLRNKLIPVDFCSRAAGTYKDVDTSPLQSLSDMTNTLPLFLSMGGKFFYYFDGFV